MFSRKISKKKLKNFRIFQVLWMKNYNENKKKYNFKLSKFASFNKKLPDFSKDLQKNYYNYQQMKGKSLKGIGQWTKNRSLA